MANPYGDEIALNSSGLEIPTSGLENKLLDSTESDDIDQSILEEFDSDEPETVTPEPVTPEPVVEASPQSPTTQPDMSTREKRKAYWAG